MTGTGRHALPSVSVGWWGAERRSGKVEGLALKFAFGWNPVLSLSEMHFSHRTRGYPLLKHTDDKIITHQSECQVINVH